MSGPPVARKDERPTHPMGRAVPKQGSFGLAPDGVCPAPDITTGTVSPYLAISPLLPEKAASFPGGKEIHPSTKGEAKAGLCHRDETPAFSPDSFHFRI